MKVDCAAAAGSCCCPGDAAPLLQLCLLLYDLRGDPGLGTGDEALPDTPANSCCTLRPASCFIKGVSLGD